MQKFIERWQIQANWQLVFPFLGVIALLYSAFKIANSISNNNMLILVFSVIIYIILLKTILFLFKKLEHKWILNYKWEMIRVFLVFAITGSSSVYVGRPFMKLIGITKDNLVPFIYWILFVLVSLIFYQILLVCFGWLFGQFKFFWNFEKKMLRRFGLGKFLK